MSAPSPTPPAPRRARRLLTGLLVTLLLGVVAGGVGIPLYLRHLSEQLTQERADNEASARAVVERYAQGFADAVLAEGDPDVPDGTLLELADEHLVEVRAVDRDPGGSVELRIVVWTREG
jgi:hypothetical protein